MLQLMMKLTLACFIILVSLIENPQKQLFGVETLFMLGIICDPNRTSGKIKLTPSAYSHTTVLLVSSLNFSQADSIRGEFTVM